MMKDRGFSLIEVMFALSILLVVALGLLPLGIIATSQTENQGHLDARVTEYAQDKLEQLMALAFGDSVSDTRVFPATSTGGSGLTVGGNANPDPGQVPVVPYVDYLDIDGTLFPAAGGEPANWFYKRIWQIEDVPAGSCPGPPQPLSCNLKRVTVSATVRTPVGKFGRIPRATVVTLKSSPF